MKNKFAYYAMLAAASLGMAACNADEDIIVSNSINAADMVEMQFGVELESPAGLSKASLAFNSSTAVFSFSGNDSLSVFASGNNSRFDYASQLNNQSAVFKGSASASASAYYSLFPYQPNATISGNTISAEIPAVQSNDADYSQYALSVAYSSKTTTSFKLKNACSLIWIDANYDSKFSKIVVEANKNIAGKVSIAVKSDNSAPEISDGTVNAITLNNPSSGLVAVIPQSGVDLKITFFRADGSSFEKEYKNINLLRSEIAYLQMADGHMVNFDPGVSGAKYPSLIVSDGTSFKLPGIEGIKNASLNFVGWKAADGKVYAVNSIIQMGKADMQFTAEWSDKCVATFYVEGVDIQNYLLFKAGESVILPEAPLREGYAFKCWLESGMERKAGQEIRPNGSVSVVAVFNPDTYTISVDGNGGLWGELTERSFKCAFNETKSMRSEFALPVRDGYTFGGYYDNPGLNGTPVTEISNPSADIKIYTRWYKEYTIKYVYENGDPILDDVNMPCIQTFSDVSFNLEINKPDWYGHDGQTEKPIGIGWVDQNGKKYNGGETISVSTLDDLQDLVLTLRTLNL